MHLRSAREHLNHPALSVTAHTRVTGPIVLNTFRTTITQYGIPASTLTDNGMVYTTRLAGGRGGRNSFETELRRLHITQKNSRHHTRQPAAKSSASNKPSRNGYAHNPTNPPPPKSCKPCSTNSSTSTKPPTPPITTPLSHPATLYNTMPKALPTDSRDPDTHDRIRHDKVNKTGSVTLRVNGRLHHIGVGRTHTGTCVILLIQDLNIRVVKA
ncbi:MAG: IS481 family transposase, partial [Candidatus Nanopelagicales bacterium]